MTTLKRRRALPGTMRHRAKQVSRRANLPIERPTLVLRIPPHLGTGQVMIFSDLVERYRHTVRDDGGWWDASWWMPLDPVRGNTEELLQAWFDNYLMHRIEERGRSGVTWEGVVWDMELTLHGRTKRRTMDTCYNAVRSDYTDTDGNQQITGWYTSAASITQLGRREMILSERYVSSNEAAGAAQSFLALNSWPHAQPTDVGRDLEPGLLVAAVGDVFTANNKYVDTTTLDGTTGNISAVVSDIATNDCQFLTPGRITTNTLQRYRRFDRPITGMDAIEELTAFGDGTDPWQFYVDRGGRLMYNARSSTPLYSWWGPDIGFKGLGDPWNLRPGVLRDMTERAGAPPPGSFLTDRRDIWIAEVEIAADNTDPILRPADEDPGEILRVQRMYEQWLDGEGV